MSAKKYRVRLSPEEQMELKALASKGRTAAYRQTHARILLACDEAQEDGSSTDEEIASVLKVGVSTVTRVRRRCVEEGLEAALGRKKQPLTLLDPTSRVDPKLITFDEQGMPLPSDPLNPIIRTRVETTVYFLNLDHVRLVQARKQKWRETMSLIEEYRHVCPSDVADCTLDDHHRLERLARKLGELTRPTSRYAATARACLRANALDFLIETPEEAAAVGG